MAYFLNTVKAGKTREITKWRKAARKMAKNSERAPKSKPTREAQRAVNREHSRRNLRWAVNDNFDVGDYWLTLTYSAEYTPTEESANQDYKKFMRNLRGLYCREKVELKYISTCLESGHRPHFHILCSKGVDAGKIQSLWKFGRVAFKLLDSSGQYSALSDYIFKHGGAGREQGKKRYHTSRNLSHPIPQTKEINAAKWRNEPTAPMGYILDRDSIERGINPVTGAEFLRYTLVELPPSGRKCAVKTRY